MYHCRKGIYMVLCITLGIYGTHDFYYIDNCTNALMDNEQLQKLISVKNGWNMHGGIRASRRAGTETGLWLQLMCCAYVARRVQNLQKGVRPQLSEADERS